MCTRATSVDMTLLKFVPDCGVPPAGCGVPPALPSCGVVVALFIGQSVVPRTAEDVSEAAVETTGNWSVAEVADVRTDPQAKGRGYWGSSKEGARGQE